MSFLPKNASDSFDDDTGCCEHPSTIMQVTVGSPPALPATTPAVRLQASLQMHLAVFIKASKPCYSKFIIALAFCRLDRLVHVGSELQSGRLTGVHGVLTLLQQARL